VKRHVFNCDELEEIRGFFIVLAGPETHSSSWQHAYREPLVVNYLLFRTVDSRVIFTFQFSLIGFSFLIFLLTL